MSRAMSLKWNINQFGQLNEFDQENTISVSKDQIISEQNAFYLDKQDNLYELNYLEANKLSSLLKE